MGEDLREQAEEVTKLIALLGEGEERAADRLLEVVYQDLRVLAASRMAREAAGATLQPTDLVHEAYLRLLGSNDSNWTGRAHFFGAAAEAMRRILIDRARRKAADCHGGGQKDESLHENLQISEVDLPDLEGLNLALDKLELEDPTKAALVKLRYFVGLTVPQAADALEISRATAARYWTYSRARLKQWIDVGD